MFTGDTNGLGLDEPNGFKEWKYTIECKDKSEEKVEIDIVLEIQRTIKDPEIIRKVGEFDIFEEERVVTLDDLFGITIEEVGDDKIFLTIENKFSNERLLKMKKTVDLDEFEPTIDGEYQIWKLTGTKSEIVNYMKQLILEPEGKYDTKKFYAKYKLFQSAR